MSDEKATERDYLTGTATCEKCGRSFRWGEAWIDTGAARFHWECYPGHHPDQENDNA